MTSFRLLLGGIAALIAAPAIAQSCVQSAERTAFEVRALQSQLMVAALACSRDGDYNAFVRKFQRDLAASYHGMAAHFRRSAGSAHQRELDSFITQLANAQSQDGIRAGSHYCPLVAPLFQVALNARNVDELAMVAVERNVLNPLSAPTCTASAAPASRPASARTQARSR